MNTINRVARWRIVFDWNFLKCVLFCSFYLPVLDGDKWHAIVTTQGMNLKCDQRRHVQDCKRERRMCESYVQSAVQSADVSPPPPLLSNYNRLLPPPPSASIVHRQLEHILRLGEWWGGGEILPAFSSWRQRGCQLAQVFTAIFTKWLNLFFHPSKDCCVTLCGVWGGVFFFCQHGTALSQFLCIDTNS